MKTSKLLSLIAFITCISLLYVYQQTEILRLAYAGQKNQSSFQDLLDKNTVLRYNMGRNASLVNIGSRVSARADLEMPDSYRFLRLASSREGLKIKVNPQERQTVLSRIFGVRRQAEAKTIP